VVDVIRELESFACHVDVIDPHADSDELMKEYGFGLVKQPANDYDAIIVAVNHKDYVGKTEDDFKKLLKDGKGVFVDLKGVYKNKIKDLKYWSL
jgi:UDP-N-acetyl-D-galactosamine dehydrogenase